MLQDSANKLKSKVKDAEKNLEKEKVNLVGEIKAIKKQIRDLEENYNYPMIIYVDMNTDVTDEKFREIEGKIRKRNWKSHKSAK